MRKSPTRGIWKGSEQGEKVKNRAWSVDWTWPWGWEEGRTEEDKKRSRSGEQKKGTQQK